MIVELKLRKVGNSVGVVLPEEALARLNADDGNVVYLPHRFLFDLFTKSTAHAQAALYRNPMVRPNRQPMLQC